MHDFPSSQYHPISPLKGVSVTLEFDSCSLDVACPYRSPITSPYAKSFSVFMTEFSDLPAALTEIRADFFITGDLNLHLDEGSNTQS